MLTIKQYQNVVEEGLKSLPLPAEPHGLYEPIRYTLAEGGKRLRPVLTLAVAQALGCEPSHALNAAMGVEMFHNFTLMHDDVMDNADMRRGRPTVHKVWDQNTAILSGDALLTLAGMTVSEGYEATVAMEAQRLLNVTAMEVYEGQQYDVDFEHQLDVTVEEYLNMIRLKTSVLLGCACRMGAVVAKASEEVKSALYDYGVKLGLAFQLQDDYLDTFGDPAVFGKEIGGDIANDKKTWLLITSLEEAEDEVMEAMAVVDRDEKIARVRKVYERLALPARCGALISKYIEEAIAALKKAGLTADDEAFFEQLALKSATRTH